MSQKTVPGSTKPRLYWICAGLFASLLVALGLLAYQTFRNHSGGLPQELEGDPVVQPQPEQVAHRPARCPAASDEQATTLLTRLFPDAKMLSFEPLALNDMKSLCLLEVEMLADKANPATRGFVYVLPDGERFLNGPLMDKRSQVAIQSTDVQAEIEKAKAEQKAVIEEARRRASSNAASPISAAPAALREAAQDPAPSESAITVPTTNPNAEIEIAKRSKFLEQLQELPAIVTGTGTKDVYVMFDPQCAHCHNLYAQHASLVAKYDLRFHWIPIFMNDASWVMSAFILKTAKSSPEKATALLKGMMEKTWDPKKIPEDAAMINAMSESDYELARHSTIAFYDATKENKGLGTPVVAFKAPNGTTEVISGEPYESDWLVLNAPKASEAAVQ